MKLARVVQASGPKGPRQDRRVYAFCCRMLQHLVVDSMIGGCPGLSPQGYEPFEARHAKSGESASRKRERFKDRVILWNFSPDTSSSSHKLSRRRHYPSG